MNKTFNINLGSYPFAIDEDAYNYIQNYLGTIRNHFSSSDGCDEILYDIEVRMAELFQEHLKGRAIISMKEIDEVIMIMGKPEDFGAEPMSETSYSSTRNRKSDTKINAGKRMFRDPDDQKLAGVCSGIAAYFGIEDPLWIRLIFAILFFTGAGVITYIILWAIVPQASSASDKLAMRGEPATIQNIAKVVEDEMSELGDKINEWSKDLGSKKKSDVNQGFSVKSFLAKAVNVFGLVVSGIIPMIRKVFKPFFLLIAILLLSVLGITWAASFVGITYASSAIAFMGPDSDTLSYLGIGSLLFTAGLPILGLMLMISRLVFNYKIHKNVRTGMWTVWFLSLFTTLFAGMSTIREYSTSHNYTTSTDYNINGNEIKIMMPEENLDHSFGFQLGNLFVDNDDQWAVRDVRFKIEKSKDALVHIEKRISSRGTDSKEAQKNSLFVTNEVQVVGSEIKISKFLLIPKDKKFRNQQIDYVIYIPEGKSIELDNNVKESMSDSGLFSYEQIYSEIENLRWTVTPKGLISDTWNDLFHHKKEISTGSYSKIIIEKGFDVIIKKAGKPNLSFEGNKKILEKIIHKNLEGTLTINAETDENLEGIRILIETPSLELIHLDGVRIAKIEGFIQDNLKLVSKGESDMNEDTNIEFFGNIKNMDISLDGRQVLTMIGTGEKIDLQITNGAGINSDKYIVKNVNFTGSNYNDSSMHVTESITCDNPNELSVHLIGNPKKVKL